DSAGALDGDDHQDHTVLSELLAVAKHHVTSLFDAESVDVDVARAPPLAGDANPMLIDRDHGPVVDGEDPLSGDAHRPSEGCVERQVTVLAVHRDEVPRPRER